MSEVHEYDALIVGAGFSGLYLLHTLRAQGLRVRILEAGAGVGGTWYWNRYPGARCDSDSVEYSYSFSPELEREWRWSERFATQPEILMYLDHVADRFDLRKDIELETRVASAEYDETRSQWLVTSERGTRYAARYCIMATGCLSSWRVPNIAGQDEFTGPTYHTGQWPHEGVDFTGKRVAVIGTGSSGIQSIPIIAEQAKELFVYQRTPNYSVPARNASLTEAWQTHVQENYATIRDKARKSGTGLGSHDSNISGSAAQAAPDEREETFRKSWELGGAQFLSTYGDLLVNEDANQHAADFVRRKIRETVQDEATAEALMPHDHPIGTKRICVDSNYYATYNLPHVTLVDLRKGPIERITAKGVKTEQTEHEVDCIVYATGFDAMTGALSRIDIRGKAGQALTDEWEGGPRSYLGLMVAGFPNLFTVTGPGSPSVLSNMTTSIEQHVEWIAECIQSMRTKGRRTIEADAAAQEAWVQHVYDVAQRTLYPKAASWYIGANVPGKPRVFMPYVGGVGAYRAKCDEVASADYTGFVFDGGTGKANAAAE